MKMIPRMVTGVVIGLAASAGFYAVAATAATAMAANFDTVETTRHARIVEISSRLKSAWSEHRLARAKCERFTAPLKALCKDDARDAAMLAMKSPQPL
jgi:hypothetical protein